MAKAKEHIKVVTLKSVSDKRSVYQTIKNIKNITERLKLRKYNRFTHQHEEHVEVKK